MPSNVLVPRPISSRITRLRGVALFRMLAVSVISTMNVLCPRLSSSVAEGDEQLVLQLAGPVLGAEDLILILLQLGRDVPLGVLDGRPAGVFGGDLRGLGV